ncbi:MAG TPA: hypothetical protein VJK26_00660 [Patescibacteria group bacterium]|nr:hypothetical protein [Patescibacteria group bacterium]
MSKSADKSSIKRITNRKIRLPICIKLFKNKKLMHRSNFTKKSSAIRYVLVHSWDNAYLKVIYGKEFYNNGIYKNIKDLREALLAFTEKSLLDFIEGS